MSINLVQLVSFINIISQNMQQSNITSYTGLLPNICEGNSQPVAFTYRQTDRMCFTDLSTCPGFKMGILNPASFWKPEPSNNIGLHVTEYSFTFDLHSAKYMTVNSSGFALHADNNGEEPVHPGFSILTNRGFSGLVPNTGLLGRTTLFQKLSLELELAFSTKKLLYEKFDDVSEAPGAFTIRVSLVHGDIKLSAYHCGAHECTLQKNFPKIIIQAPKTDIREVQFELGVLVDLARKQILIINLTEGDVVTEFRNVDTGEPLWTLFNCGSMDWARITPKHIILRQLKARLELMRSWNISQLELLGLAV